MKKRILIYLLFFYSINLFAQNDGAGNTGLSFLKTGINARAIAMGDAYSSISEDATSIIYNPALINSGKSNVSLSHNIALVDFTSSFIGTKFVFNKLGVGIGIMRAGVNDIEVRLTPGAPLEKFNSQDISINLGFSYNVYENISVGVATKFLYEKIYIDEASGFGFDIGTNYKKDKFSFSFVLANIGSIDEMKNARTKLPTLVRFGSSYQYPYKDFNFIAAVEGFKVLEGGKFHIHSGIEAGYKDILFIRVGYQTNYENKNFSAGLGFKYKGITIDYAFIPYSHTFGSGNTFSIGYNF
ncbi:MAG: PorV/PorQ family protein [Ignavibacteria bacterium]|nr:PorV/PorQ family protein [Ignavibacteria bacterium]